MVLSLALDPLLMCAILNDPTLVIVCYWEAAVVKEFKTNSCILGSNVYQDNQTLSLTQATRPGQLISVTRICPVLFEICTSTGLDQSLNCCLPVTTRNTLYENFIGKNFHNSKLIHVNCDVFNWEQIALCNVSFDVIVVNNKSSFA